jgi:hypothetical protein
MNLICRHCNEPVDGRAYRVISEQDGVVLLNMFVCASCAAVAKSLALHTEEIVPDKAASVRVTDLSGLLFPNLE